MMMSTAPVEYGVGENACGSLTGQVALVTGGGRGLGRAFAQALAAAGAAVAVAARSGDEVDETASLIAGAGGQALALQLDVTIPESVADTVALVQRRLGPVDLLINNAGTSGAVGAIAEADPTAWWRTLEVNLRGVFLVAHAVLPSMVARGRGRIINVSSSAGTKPWPYVSAYAISKAAVLHFTENLAKEVRKRGIAVFGIHPGIVRTAMLEQVLEVEAPPDSPEGLVRDWFLQQLSEGLEVPPERAADLVMLLAQGRADGLSGRYLSVYDDVTALIERAEEIRRDNLYTLRLRNEPAALAG
jgi:NAD(P)-dependent dehydrogenase (short-subunit alcohol dehydrogenase family)